MMIQERLKRSNLIMLVVPVAGVLLAVGLGVLVLLLETIYLPRLGLTMQDLHTLGEQAEPAFADLKHFVVLYGVVVIAVLLAAVVFGPGAGFAVGAVADIIGGVLAGYAINPLITLGAGAIGLVAGFAWQKLNRLSTNLRLAASVLLGHFVGSMVITSLALRLFYGYPWATLAVRIPNALILSAVNVVLLRILLENRSLMKLAKK